MLRIKSEITLLLVAGDLVANGEPRGKKKIRTFLKLAFLAVFIFFAMSFFFFLSSPRSPVSTPVVPNVKPVTPHYLPYPNGNDSQIFLVSATPTYGSYPGPSVSQMGSMPGVQKGDPCFIMDVTIRSDYTVENPLPNQDLSGNHNSTEATIFLTAQIFNAQGLITATDVTPPYPGIPFGGAHISLNGGENATVTIYLATNHQDIDHFEIVPEYIGAIPPP